MAHTVCNTANPPKHREAGKTLGEALLMHVRPSTLPSPARCGPRLTPSPSPSPLAGATGLAAHAVSIPVSTATATTTAATAGAGRALLLAGTSHHTSCAHAAHAHAHTARGPRATRLLRRTVVRALPCQQVL